MLDEERLTAVLGDTGLRGDAEGCGHQVLSTAMLVRYVR